MAAYQATLESSRTLSDESWDVPLTGAADSTQPKNFMVKGEHCAQWHTMRGGELDDPHRLVDPVTVDQTTLRAAG